MEKGRITFRLRILWSSWGTVLLMLGVQLLSVMEVVEGQDVTLQLLQTLQDSINAVNQTNINYQNQINALNAQLQQQIRQEAADFSQATAITQALGAQLTTLTNRVTAAEGALGDAQGQISALEASLTDALARVDRLESANKIWRSNFQIVNRTFTELRRKYKLTIPMIRLPVFVTNQNVRG